ncbi:glycosyltransferase family 4 protein [Vibrio owensii]|uniref:glycosyltransferase family 4 protein n=1 Tax=Vibrio owensii TaxID=696485 RepID=UPI002F42D74C
MKIAFFDFNNNFGGAPRGSLSLANRLKERGANVTVLDAYGQCEEYIKQLNEYRLNYDVLNSSSKHRVIGGNNIFSRIAKAVSQTPDFIKLVLNLRTSIKKNDLDLLWVNNKKSLFFAKLASLGLDVKIFLYYRGWGTEREFDSFFKILVKSTCSGLIGHSRATVSKLNEMFPFLNPTYVPNSVDYDLNFQPDISLLQGKDNIKILLPAARPVREKGHFVAVMALKELSEKYSDKHFELIFPGTVPIGTSNEFVNTLNQYIESNGLTDKVHFIGWKDSLKETILESDIVILPSHTEGFPRVVIESMLLNRPVIATPVGGIPEAIKDGTSGYLIDIDSHNELVRKVELLIENDLNLVSIVENATRYARAEFCPRRQADLVFERFERAIG